MTIEALDFNPAPGTIQKDTQLTFDVRSDSPFLRIIVAVDSPGLEFIELAYAQDPAGASASVFSPQFSGTIEQITDPGFDRYRFRLLRLPVWLDSPTIRIYAFNTAGEEL